MKTTSSIKYQKVRRILISFGFGFISDLQYVFCIVKDDRDVDLLTQDLELLVGEDRGRHAVEDDAVEGRDAVAGGLKERMR